MKQELRNVIIFRNKLEISRTCLNQRKIVIGRSSQCDVVLRAPGVKEQHFMLEWVGSGEFDPRQDKWMLVNVSQDGSGAVREGAAFSGHPLKMDGFTFQSDSSRLDKPISIVQQISREFLANDNPSGKSKDVVEVIWTKRANGAIQEIVHLPLKQLQKVTRPIPKLAALRIKAQKASGEDAQAVELLLDQMPGATIANPKQTSPVLTAADSIELNWNEEKLSLRLVSAVESAGVSRDRPRILAKFALTPTLMLLFISGLIPAAMPTSDKKDLDSPPLLAQIEIKKEQPVAEIAPPPPANKIEISDSSSGGASANKSAAESQRANLPAAPTQKVKSPGLAKVTPAAKTNINQIGLLGFLAKNESPRSGIKAQAVINQLNQAQTLSNNAVERGVVVKQPPAGPAGSINSGGRGALGMGAASLASATNTNAVKIGNSVTGLGGTARVGAYGDGNGGSLNVGKWIGW